MSDKAFREWVQRQPSCLSGLFSEWVDGEGRNPACHVRRASSSGTGYKAEYSCIPLTHQEHRDQHQHGESGCLRIHLGGKWEPDEAKEFFDRMVERYREEWELYGKEKV